MREDRPYLPGATKRRRRISVGFGVGGGHGGLLFQQLDWSGYWLLGVSKGAFSSMAFAQATGEGVTIWCFLDGVGEFLAVVRSMRSGVGCLSFIMVTLEKSVCS